MKTINRRLFVIFLGLILLTPGCWWGQCDVPFVPTLPRINSFSQNPQAPLRRVAMLPMDAREPGNLQFANSLYEQVGSALRATGRFEVIMLTPEQLSVCRNPVVTDGRFDERELVHLARRYNIDGVVYSQLERGNVYGPIAADVSCLLVDTREAVVVSKVDGSWNLDHPADMNRFEKYWELTHNEFASFDSATNSPMLVAGFIATEIAEELGRR